MSLVFSLGLALRRPAAAQATAPATSPPANIALPVISGAAVSGQTLSAGTGSWTNSPTGYAWQWRRGGSAIAGATSSAYTLQAADLGATITVRVTATNAAGSAQAVSAPTAPVAAAGAAPANTVLPAISGLAQVGQTLTASLGSWTGSPTPVLAGEWRRGAVSLGTGLSYTVQPGDLGARLSFRVTATNAEGSASASSAETAVVTQASGEAPANVAPPQLVGPLVEGATITVPVGSWTNAPTSFSVQLTLDGVDVPGAVAVTAGAEASFLLDGSHIDGVPNVRVTASNAAGAATAASDNTRAVLFAWELLTETASATIDDVPNLRVSLDAGATWLTLATAGLSVARHADGDKLVLSGFADAAARDAVLVHFEQKQPGEPNNGYNQHFALFARRRGDAGPINPALPGLSVSPTVYGMPLGVS